MRMVDNFMNFVMPKKITKEEAEELAKDVVDGKRELDNVMPETILNKEELETVKNELKSFKDGIKITVDGLGNELKDAKDKNIELQETIDSAEFEKERIKTMQIARDEKKKRTKPSESFLKYLREIRGVDLDTVQWDERSGTWDWGFDDDYKDDYDINIKQVKYHKKTGSWYPTYNEWLESIELKCDVWSVNGK